MQSEIDAANAKWWNELCGSGTAVEWGMTDNSPESLKRFDDNFFAFYPYLEKWLPWESFKGWRTLEIGTGYGSITQRLAEHGASVTAMDIAANPVAMADFRFRTIGADHCRAIQGNLMQPPASLGRFDRIVAIGCLHHTGDLAAAIDRCYDLLSPGGQLTAMVYYTFSHRQWWQNPRQMWRQLSRERAGYRGSFREGGTEAYDRNSDGSLAPSTEFVSIRGLKEMCSKFRKVTCGLENAYGPPFQKLTRDRLLNSWRSRWLGLDLYWTASK